MKNRLMIKDLVSKVGEEAVIAGWVHVRRDHGKLAFFEIRDASGLVQAVYFRAGEKLDSTIDKLRSEFVVKISGLVKARPEKMINPDHPTGTIEFEIQNLIIINESATPPFEITETKESVHEDKRMQYRYLDLRREKMQFNIRFRHKLISEFRRYLDDADFVEIETPILTKSSPEGARDYLVPSRLSPGKFFALPQAPQQFKQLLMIAGFEKYYQIARCFRDEDQRGDRQPEFTQLDLEMSFVSEEDILEFNEAMFRNVISSLMPEKKLPKKFPRLTYAEAMEKYDSDKPDLREDKNDSNELAFCWIVDFPVFEKTPEGHLTFAHNPFALPKADDTELLKSDKEEDLLKMRAHCYDLVLNGVEISSGSMRIHDPKIQKAIFERFGLSDTEVQERFGNFLAAFKYGTPPHGGMAPGIDRLVTVLLDEQSIREVIAFPKTGDAHDLMFDSPGLVSSAQLNELNIKITDKKKKD
ncbi:aspartate--tRNA ligase [Candidatus Saccharibacteria bacterium]|nr:aspartate--tRNA ligase [Candidatus Saccharibacteria bacterium]